MIFWSHVSVRPVEFRGVWLSCSPHGSSSLCPGHLAEGGYTTPCNVLSQHPPRCRRSDSLPIKHKGSAGCCLVNILAKISNVIRAHSIQVLLQVAKSLCQTKAAGEHYQLGKEASHTTLRWTATNQALDFFLIPV